MITEQFPYLSSLAPRLRKNHDNMSNSYGIKGDRPEWNCLESGCSESHLLDPILLKNSSVGDCVMLPWSLTVEYAGEYHGPIWEDPKGMLELSLKQKKKFSKWVRYFSSRKNVKIFGSTPCSSRIQQGFVGDCSFLSSLASLAEYEKSYGVPVLTSVIKYVNLGDNDAIDILKEHGIDIKSVFGTKGTAEIAIGCKLHFNGTERCVLVDDWVPIREDGRLLCAHSNDEFELWVTLLEKAFVKLLGGSYMIQGTNPGVDIYRLTGWMPDIIPLPANASNEKGKESVKRCNKWDDVWDTLYAGFCNGSCVICLGTRDIWDAAPSGLGYAEGISLSSGIVSGHAYSVLKVKCVSLADGNRARLLFVKNPWGKVSWTGRFSPYDDVMWTKDLRETLDYSPNKEDNGIFWIEWKDVLRWFSHLYISWRPGMFQYFCDFHGIWNRNERFLDSVVPEDVYLSVFNPQIKLTVHFEKQNFATVWLMLLQHKQSPTAILKYLALHVFSQKKPILCPAIPDVQGVYNNGECILLKLLVKKGPYANHLPNQMLEGETVTISEISGECSLILLLSYYMDKVNRPTAFSLKSFSTVRVNLKKEPCLIKDNWKREILWGEWNETNCGGNPSSTWQFFTNPHYRLEFEEDTEAVVLLESNKPLSLNLRIFRGRVATVRALKTKQTVGSDEYKIHCCGTHMFFKAGQYTLIPSTFRAGDLAKFRIVVYSCNGSCKLAPIPYPHGMIPKSNGLYVKQVKSVSGVLNIQVSVRTLVSIKIQQYENVFDRCVLFASSKTANHPKSKGENTNCSRKDVDGTFCSNNRCVHCGGPCGRFISFEMCEFPMEHSLGYDLMLSSDLNGGISKNGKTPSAAAQHLFQSQGTINFTLASLLPSSLPYRLNTFIPNANAIFTFTSDSPLLIL